MDSKKRKPTPGQLPPPTTEQRLRAEFLQHMRRMALYWSEVPNISKLEALNGLAFSTLTAIDGCSVIPGYSLVTAQDGKLVTINHDTNLHDEYYDAVTLARETATSSKHRKEQEEAKHAGHR